MEKTKFNKNQTDINNLIEIISSIRSTKAELKITPKLFCDISFIDKSKKLKNLRGLLKFKKINKTFCRIQKGRNF